MLKSVFACRFFRKPFCRYRALRSCHFEMKVDIVKTLRASLRYCVIHDNPLHHMRQEILWPAKIRACHGQMKEDNLWTHQVCLQLCCHLHGDAYCTGNTCAACKGLKTRLFETLIGPDRVCVSIFWEIGDKRLFARDFFDSSPKTKREGYILAHDQKGLAGRGSLGNYCRFFIAHYPGGEYHFPDTKKWLSVEWRRPASCDLRRLVGNGNYSELGG